MDSIGITVDDDNKKLPSMYANPKQHKNPVKFRFIAAGVKCTTKTMSKIISAALTHVLKTVKNYYNYQFNFKKGSPYWVVQNRTKIINDVTLLNSRCKAKTVASYDFTTLYTSIPHGKLIDAVKFVIEDGFKCSKKSFLVASKSRAYWSDKQCNSKRSCSFSKELLVEWLEYLVNNIFVTFQHNVYQQIIGIPMGTDCAPVLANLFLFYYELMFVLSLDDQEISEKFSFTEFTSRYLDDLPLFLS